MSYRIGTVSALTGINQSTLRAWERRYGIVDPQRSEGGYRVYSREDVARLSRVKELVDRGLKVSEAVDAVTGPGHALHPRGDDPVDIPSIRTELFNAVVGLDRRATREVLGRVNVLRADRQVEEVILPILREIGRLWSEGEVSVAEEHFASSALRDHLVHLLNDLGAGARGTGDIVCAGAPGERHENGILAVSVHLALAGWRLTYLGTDLPIEEIVSVIEQREPTAGLISVVQPLDAEACEALGRSVRAGISNGTTVVVGGTGVPESLRALPVAGLHFVRTIREMQALPPFSKGPGQAA